MTLALSVIIASYDPKPFKLIDEVVRSSGHCPAAYVVSRSMRPAAPSEPEFLNSISEILGSIPNGMDMLLPGRPSGLKGILPGYQPDLMIVSGFNWRLPPEVLSIPRLGVLNVHPSLLPKYRGPSPVLWAVRNGDSHFGVTVHRMDEGIDTGPIMAKSDPVPLPDQVTHEEIWDRIAAVLPEILVDAIQRTADGEPGQPQDAEQATYAGFPPDSWFTVDWTDSRVSIHNQLRVLRLLRPDEGIFCDVSGRRVRLRASSLEESSGGLPAQCGDGVIWLTDWEEV